VEQQYLIIDSTGLVGAVVSETLLASIWQLGNTCSQTYVLVLTTI